MRRSNAHSHRSTLLTQCLAVALLFFFLESSPAAEASSISSIANLGNLGIGNQGNLTPISLNGETIALPGYAEESGINPSATVVGTSLSTGGPSVTTSSKGQARELNIPGDGHIRGQSYALQLLPTANTATETGFSLERALSRHRVHHEKRRKEEMQETLS